MYARYFKRMNKYGECSVLYMIEAGQEHSKFYDSGMWIQSLWTLKDITNHSSNGYTAKEITEKEVLSEIV